MIQRVRTLAIAGLLGAGALPLAAAAAMATPACTGYLDGSLPEVHSGEVICGGPHDDHVGTIDAGGVFLAGDGFDSVDENDGTFDGGGGADRVFDLNAGTFWGGDGEDAVEGVNTGTFDGGASSDQVANNYGTVYGGDSTDVVFRQFDGFFHGGDGSDIVGRMVGGTYDGEAGHDRVFRNLGGTLISVEKIG
jgi:hypothetical protein